MKATAAGKMRWFVWLTIAVAAALSMRRAWYFDGYTDFNVYYDFAVKVRELWFGDQSPSFGVDPTNSSPFRYLPFWGVLFLPFSFLPIGPARAVFVGIQWLFYGSVFSKAQSTFKLTSFQQLILLLGTFRFAWDNAKIGQVSCLLLYFIWWAMPHAWDSRGRARHLALAVSLKLQPIGLLGVALINGHLSYVVRVLLCGALLVALSLLVGIEALESWAILSFSSLQVLDPTTIGNQSLYGALVRVFPKYANLSFLGIFLFTGMILIEQWSRLGRPSQLGWLMGIAFLPVFGGLTWKNTYVLSLIPLAFLLSRKASFAVILAVGFQLLSQGVLGEALNAFTLHYGFLPWFAWFAWIVGFAQAIHSLQPKKHWSEI